MRTSDDGHATGSLRPAKGAGMNDTELIDLAGELVEAFNAADWPRFRATLGDEVTYEEAGTGRQVHGADDYLRLCQGWKEAFPDVSGKVRTAVAGGDTVAQEVEWVGTHTGPLATPAGAIPPSGKSVKVAGTLWYAVADEKFRSVRHHLDVMALLQQIGALPSA
jgi:steroid delta-isomerase-like uncharacterized protein